MDKTLQDMVSTIRFRYGFDNDKVAEVMQNIPRVEFVPKKYKRLAYTDTPIDIGYGQTISQPYTVAFMTHLLTNSKLKIQNSKLGKVLEIGTGSGYQAAVLSYFFDEVFTVEIIPQLARRAKEILRELGYANVFVRTGSGEYGWVQKAPFDAILVTAGVEKIPRELFNQLKAGGVLVAPVGVEEEKVMTRFTKFKKNGKEEIIKEEFGIFTFVPFITAG